MPKPPYLNSSAEKPLSIYSSKHNSTYMIVKRSGTGHPPTCMCSWARMRRHMHAPRVFETFNQKRISHLQYAVRACGRAGVCAPLFASWWGWGWGSRCGYPIVQQNIHNVSVKSVYVIWRNRFRKQNCAVGFCFLFFLLFLLFFAFFLFFFRNTFLISLSIKLLRASFWAFP